jgi:hypothetical protein
MTWDVEYVEDVIEPELDRLLTYYSSSDLSSFTAFEAATRREFGTEWPWLVRNADLLWELLQRGVPPQEAQLILRRRELKEELILESPRREEIQRDLREVNLQLEQVRAPRVAPRQVGSRWRSRDTEGRQVVHGLNSRGNHFVSYAKGVEVRGVKVGGRFVKKEDW